MPPRKQALEIASLLIDVNSSAYEAALSNPLGKSDFDMCSEIADSLICRKIFSQATDRYSLTFFGAQIKAGFYTPQKFEIPTFQMIEELQNVNRGERNAISAIDAIDYALTQMEEPEAQYNVKGKTIFLLTNMGSTSPKKLTTAAASSLGKKLKKLDVELYVASPDDLVESDGPIKSFMTELEKHSDSKWLPFSKCVELFQSFVPKQTTPRGQPFVLQLDEESGIKVQMFVKNNDAKVELKYNPCSLTGEEDYKKHFHHTTAPDVVVSAQQLDEIPDDEIRSGQISVVEESKRIIEQGNLMKGFNYGKNIVPVSELDIDYFKADKGEKELSLVHFTKRSNILTQFKLSNARYILPAVETAGSQRVFYDLVRQMLEDDVVAICRYAYNSNSHTRTVCLIPKLTKDDLPILIHYVLPFGEDVRNFEFPPLNDDVEPLTDYQKDVMDDYVDRLMLAGDEKVETFRPAQVHDPRFQNECLMLRHKALHPESILPDDADTKDPISSLRMPNIEEMKDCADLLREAFPLSIEASSTAQLFSNREIGEYDTPVKAELDFDFKIKSEKKA